MSIHSVVVGRALRATLVTFTGLATGAAVSLAQQPPAAAAHGSASGGSGHTRHPAHPAADTQAALRAEAKVGEDSARAIARREVPNGRVQSLELEREHGKLIYSMDVKVAGRAGIEEINVDAVTGTLIAHEHETPKAERREARQEAREQGAHGTATRMP